MDLQLTGKTALVTGASQGIGRAISKGLAQEGVHVAIVARRKNLLGGRVSFSDKGDVLCQKPSERVLRRSFYLTRVHPHGKPF